MVRREVAGARIARAAAWLDDASRILDQPIDAFVAATRDRDLALFYLFLAIQGTIDLSAHWVADAGWGAPDDAGSTFDVLAARHCIDHDLAISCVWPQGFAIASRTATRCSVTRGSTPSPARASLRCDGSSRPWL